MKLSHLLIDHPWFAILVSIFIVIRGLLTMASLAIAQYPNVVPLTTQITTRYPGASAETIARTVAIGTGCQWRRHFGSDRIDHADWTSSEESDPDSGGRQKNERMKMV
jgi:hypothetical protein